MDNISGKELLANIYGKELNTKKTILEYIEISKKYLKDKEECDNLVKETYDIIDESIESMKDSVKLNTVMYLKNELKSAFKKIMKNENKEEVKNSFIEFFKKSYPEGKRRRSYTYVLIDNDTITTEQIWHTLKYINRQCIKTNLQLSDVQKKDVKKMIRKVEATREIQYINQIKSLDKLLRIVNIRL